MNPSHRHVQSCNDAGKTLLELMDAPTNTNISTFQARIAEAMQYLQDIRSYPPPPSPAPDSAAAFALDPYVARRLNSFLPLRVFELPPQNEVWESIGALLRGWHELSLISNTASLTTWEVRCRLNWYSCPLKPRVDLWQSSKLDPEATTTYTILEVLYSGTCFLLPLLKLALTCVTVSILRRSACAEQIHAPLDRRSFPR